MDMGAAKRIGSDAIGTLVVLLGPKKPFPLDGEGIFTSDVAAHQCFSQTVFEFDKTAWRTAMTRRFCYALDLQDDPELIAEYERYHRAENAWPEITASLRAAGIEQLEIYRAADRLFMIMEVNDAFDPAAKASADAADPKVQAWEQLMWRFQKPLPGAAPGEKWRAMDLIYDLQAAVAAAKA